MPADPVRVQLSRKKGWRMPPNTVKVDRSTKWGNPFGAIDGDAARAANAFRLLFEQKPSRLRHSLLQVGGAMPGYGEGRVLDMKLGLPEIRRKHLACWCRLCAAHRDGKPLGVICADCAPCHADVLLELANKPRCVEVSDAR